MSENNLIEKARLGEARFFLQFGGQGVPWFKELERYYENPDFAKFFETVFQALEEEKPRVEGSIGLPHGIDLEAWLKDKESIPSEAYLSYASVSLPLVQLTQLAHYHNLIIQGISQHDLVKWSLGASGHSQGIIGAAFVAMDSQAEVYYKNLAQFTKLQLYLGISAQKVYPYPEASSEELAESQALASASIPSPMVAVLGTDHKTIANLVDEINKELVPEKQIYISLYNSPSNRILSSHRSSLIAFAKKYQSKIAEKQFKFIYLMTSCPFHCPLLKDMSPIIAREIEHINFQLYAKELKLPVYSFYDGANYQDLEGNLADRMFRDLMLHTLHWDKAMKPVADNNAITHILDFGPGKTSQRLSAESLKEFEIEKPILALAKTSKELGI